MKHKVSELDGELLDAAVALADGRVWRIMDAARDGEKWCVTPRNAGREHNRRSGDFDMLWQPSTDWDQGGPIIERERISVGPGLACWYANIGGRGDDYAGPAPLIAAMRAYVASKFGDEVELP